MSAYTDYRLRLKLLSPLGTPMQSDTLFGHLAWQIARRDGPDAVAEFLAPFLAGAPPFILSDAFPAGLLPKPLFPSKGTPQDQPREIYAETKHRAKAPFLHAEDFINVAKGKAANPEPVPSPWRSIETPHAAIDRNTWTTTPGGQFFFTEAQVLTSGFDSLDLYIRAANGWAEKVTDLIRDMAPAGFGRDKSVGYGVFEVLDLVPWNGFGPIDRPDAFISLSTYMPAAADPVDGRWRVRVKRGCLGEMAGQGNPFKRPMIQFEPGAVFRTPGPPKPFYGRIVSGIAPGMPGAVQCALTLAVPARWPQ